jgi:peptide/nickel transport system substrate-binding protein
MRFLRLLTCAVVAVLGAGSVLAQGAGDVPRNQTLIVENPEGTIKNPGWFNIWAVNAGDEILGKSGQHQQ